MPQAALNWAHIERDCKVKRGVFALDGRPFGLRIEVPPHLQQHAPYSNNAYAFLQGLRAQVRQHGVIVLPDLPLNPCNYTLAQRSPHEHGYSSNPYLTDLCQAPHQDTPPYPTAFWLDAPRRWSATWIMRAAGAQRYYAYAQAHPQLNTLQIHRVLVPLSLAQGWGLLLNQTPGLLLIDNSNASGLYHARTCNFRALDALLPQEQELAHSDSPMYAFNEVGLQHYIDQLDERRGAAHRDAAERERTLDFMQAEQLRD